jgi:hypothetical protein
MRDIHPRTRWKIPALGTVENERPRRQFEAFFRAHAILSVEDDTEAKGKVITLIISDKHLQQAEESFCHLIKQRAIVNKDDGPGVLVLHGKVHIVSIGSSLDGRKFITLRCRRFEGSGDWRARYTTPPDMWGSV